MSSNSPDPLKEILRTTLYLVEQRRDLDQQAPSVTKLKQSMRRTIEELESKKPPEIQIEEPAKRSLWERAMRGGRRRGKS